MRQEHAHAKGRLLILQSGEDAHGLMLASVGYGYLNQHTAGCPSDDSFSPSPHLSPRCILGHAFALQAFLHTVHQGSHPFLLPTLRQAFDEYMIACKNTHTHICECVCVSVSVHILRDKFWKQRTDIFTSFLFFVTIRKAENMPWLKMELTRHNIEPSEEAFDSLLPCLQCSA